MSLRRSFDAVLLPLGFQNSGENWNRRSDSVIEVVSIQRDRVTSTVAIAVGVCDVPLYSKVWQAPPPLVLHEGHCAVRQRLRSESAGDEWWPMKSIRLPDVEAALRSQGLGFFERMRTRESQIEWLSDPSRLRRAGPNEILHLAYAYQAVGRPADACDLLARHGRRVIGEWRARVEEVVAELGCR
jgi:hypothetical protein